MATGMVPFDLVLIELGSLPGLISMVTGAASLIVPALLMVPKSMMIPKLLIIAPSLLVIIAPSLLLIIAPSLLVMTPSLVMVPSALLLIIAPALLMITAPGSLVMVPPALMLIMPPALLMMVNGPRFKMPPLPSRVPLFVRVPDGKSITSTSPLSIVRVLPELRVKSKSKITCEFMLGFRSMWISSLPEGSVSVLQLKGSDQKIPSPPPSQHMAVATVIGLPVIVPKLLIMPKQRLLMMPRLFIVAPTLLLMVPELVMVPPELLLMVPKKMLVIVPMLVSIPPERLFNEPELLTFAVEMLVNVPSLLIAAPALMVITLRLKIVPLPKLSLALVNIPTE